MTIEQYIESINKRYKLGNSTEHTFRGDLQQLIESLVAGIAATNEPQRISCGAPDYIITKKDIPVGYIEAKDIGADLNNPIYREQFDRYRASLNNLIITDYIDFRFYLDGDYKTSIRIAEIKNGKLVPIPENFAAFEALVRDFCFYQGQTIKSSRKLAEMMAAKARMLADVIEKALNSDENTQENSSLKDQFLAFRDILIHDIHTKDFADVYAQTIAYGMFAARLNDTSLDTFSRQEAATLIPKTNPFLRKLFQYIAGYDLDSRISWIVDGLADVFRATDVAALLQNFGSATQTLDPIIHFYETFLSEYDSKLRKARGVWYTPDPVVNFIVRAIDYILRADFGIQDGLADNTKIVIKVNVPGVKNLIEQQVHRVQFLDPTTGTGTFLAEIIKQIYAKFKGQEGVWSDYVEKHLIPRLNGFEILMASYAMAHLKLSMLLKQTGYVPKIEQRFRIYLTNSLEEHHPDTGTLFANWLSTEANEANHVKRDTPIMVVTGNPPYSISSSNKSEWIESLTADYKKDLNERNIQPLSDDYIKFIRFGQHFIDKNEEGILAYITNNSFLDGIIHRQMRKHLLQSFDKIYILDLHGNAKKKEVCPDGSADQNVFDIMQGVSINLFVKTGKKKKNESGQVFQFDLYGKREVKYDYLLKYSLESLVWDELKPEAPNYYLVKKDFGGSNEYEKGFKIEELFNLNSSGIKTHRDHFVIDFQHDTLLKKINEFYNSQYSDLEVGKKFDLKDNRDWSISSARKFESFNPNKITYIEYRPFDNRFCYYESSLIDFGRENVMKHFLGRANLGLSLLRQSRAGGVGNYWINKSIIGKDAISSLDTCTTFPLYLYPVATAQQSINKSVERTPNLNPTILKQIAEKLGLTFTAEKNSPPSEGCPQGGVGNEFPMQVSPQGGVVNSPESIICSINNIPIKRNYVENLPANHTLTQRAKEKRKAGILSEVLFWQQVHKGAFHKIDFDRQRIIGNYIVDFYVKALGLVIEIDGNSHDTKVEYDKKRQLYLENLGLKVYRITDGDVKMNLGIVLAELETYIVDEYGEKTTPVFDHPSEGGEKATPVFDHPSEGGEFVPLDILDYIYAVLHSPTYREKYKEFLKIDFPRVPYPKDASTFWQLVAFGGELRQVHLLESSEVNNYITQYPLSGNNIVGKVVYKDGNVYINDTQYFGNVPQVAWEFYIGGYQPAQKWLKDRKGRELSYDDILHYQKIIVALAETDRIMKEIDTIAIE